jgi:hypothetical protein
MEYNLQKLCEQRLLEEGRKERYHSILKGVISDENIDILVKDAISVFKRDDRVIWYLRWYKLVYINNQKKHYEHDEKYRGLYSNDEKIQYKKQLEWREKFFKYTLKQNKNDEDAYSEDILRQYFDRFSGSMINSIESNIKHSLSLPIQEIHDYQFEWQTPFIIWNKFRKLEEDWQAKQSEDAQWIEITEELENKEIEIIHNFNDGWYWFDLKKEYCDLEGDAMGHCGNSADHRDGDTVLSLRKIKKQRGRIFSRPSLTFILREGGVLGEMKGRENNKPKERYHPYILKLLKIKKNGDWLVQDVVGGGYAPEGNFDLDDLSGERLSQLYKVRPDLKPLIDIYQEEGLTEDIINKLKTIDGFKSIDKEKDLVLYEAFDNLEELLYTVKSEKNEFNLEQYHGYIKGDEYWGEHQDYFIADEQLEDLYENVLYKDNSKELAKKIYYYIKAAYEIEIEEYGLDDDLNWTSVANYRSQFKFLNERDDDIIDQLRNAYEEGERSGSESEMYDYFRHGLNDLTIESADGDFEFSFHFTDTYGDGEIYYEMSIPEAIELYTKYKSSNYDDITEFLNGDGYEVATLNGDMGVPYYGFSGYDEDLAIERFKELLDENGVLDYDDPDQIELKLESSKKYLQFF